MDDDASPKQTKTNHRKHSIRLYSITMASHTRPQLNVDMRLVPEDEPIRMPVTSKKRRLRYALLDDDDSSEEDNHVDVFQQQQAAGEEPFEEYRESAFQKYNDDKEQFVLPQQDDSSSSESSSDNDDDENEVPRHGESFAFQPQYDNEDDFFEAAFMAPENRSTQHNNSSWDKPYVNQQHDDFPCLNQEEEHDIEVLDLCDDDDDNDNGFAATQQRVTFNGVRTPRKSPRFNANSRHCFSPNAHHLERPPETVKDDDDDDDIVECWSSEDELDDGPRARRVTNVHERSFQQINTTNSRNNRNAQKEPTFAPRAFQNVAIYPSTLQNEHDDDDEPVLVPAPSRQREVLNRFKAQHVDRRRRVRDATAGIHTAASVMLRNSAPFEQAPDSLWFGQGQSAALASASHTSATSRNDLMGGSGVGAGSYTFTAGQSFQPSIQKPANPAAPVKRRKQKATNKKTTTKKKSTAGGKKKNWGGKNSYYRKKGGGKGKSSSRGGGRSSSNRVGSNEEYSRQDPLLGGVGGASIIF